MSAERFYILVNPAGDICLVKRVTGAVVDGPFPIQMKDEWGRILPYAEQGPHNYGCVPGDMTEPSEIFTPIQISAEQYQEIGHLAFYCYRYKKQGRKIELRPGHYKKKVEPGLWGRKDREYYHIGVSYPEDLELCGIAYGGRPIYWIRWNSEKSHTDFPELTAQGCLHPLKYKPRHRIQEDVLPRRQFPQWLLTSKK